MTVGVVEGESEGSVEGAEVLGGKDGVYVGSSVVGAIDGSATHRTRLDPSQSGWRSFLQNVYWLQSLH